MKNLRLLIPFYFLSVHAILWVHCIPDGSEKLKRFRYLRINATYTIIVVINICFTIINSLYNG